MTETTGRVALVTGGNRGIGEAIARRLAAEGARVAITHVKDETAAQAAALAAELGGLALQLDTADAAAVVATVDKVAAHFGRFDILVSNAAMGNRQHVDEVTLETLQRAMAINLTAPFVAAQAAARHMTENGRIITIGTTNAVRVPRQFRSVYATTKSGLVGMTKAMAHDWGDRSLTVNLVNPGTTKTQMLPAADDDPLVLQMVGFNAIKRRAMPADIAGLVAFVAREEAWFITGAVLACDGGYTA